MALDILVPSLSIHSQFYAECSNKINQWYSIVAYPNQIKIPLFPCKLTKCLKCKAQIKIKVVGEFSYFYLLTNTYSAR